MYVRIPLDVEYSEQNFRNFRLGQIQTLDDIANTARVRFYDQVEDEPEELELALEYLDRSFILPGTNCQFASNHQHGYILYRCGDMLEAGNLAEYYVLTEGATGVVRVRENDLQVFRNRQDYDPQAQLSRYEFQNPIWMAPRDHLIEVYSELQNATFGLDELVGARLMLFAHQAEAIAQVLADTTCRYILADEVGLGKTIEACVILKGLRRRYAHLRTLIITPASLAMQWQNELDAKFWLKFPLIRNPEKLADLEGASCILCTEDLTLDTALWQEVHRQHWDLLIVDEAHHIIKQPVLYQRMRQLSAETQRVLILSATPIQRRKQEYLSLLALVNPARYHSEHTDAFAQLLESQQKIVKRISILSSLLSGDFDAEEFLEELEPILKLLKQDQVLISQAKQLGSASRAKDGGQQQARELLSYLGENYRIERRIIRNRRVHLTVPFPSRTLNTTYSYTPDTFEAETLDMLYEYLEEYILQYGKTPLATEFVRVWMHTAASSPYALLTLLKIRLAQLTRTPEHPGENELHAVQLATGPREEALRVERILAWAPRLSDEKTQWMEPLLHAAERWLEQTQVLLEKAASSLSELPNASTHRLLQVMNAVHALWYSRSKAKIILFSSWLPTLDALYPALHKRYSGLAIALFTSDMGDEELQNQVDRFQSNPSCRILLCDELGGEGRNFQIADQIVHIDLPWTPAQVEQRIGRIDRIGRSGDVLSLVPFAQGWPEEALFRLWQDAFQLFTRSMSGLEIALEGVQDELYRAALQSVRHGWEDLLPGMVARAEQLREEVEEERYYEMATINNRLHEEFSQLSDKYRDGQLLQQSCIGWARLAGLHVEPDYDNQQIIRFNPRKFSIKSMKNAKFLHVPNMEEALARSRRKQDLIVTGTFNRDFAVNREDLVFFAPGNDPWIDTIIENATSADRGRCCAIRRSVPDFQGIWRGFEFFYSLTIDPRPLYKQGFDPTHLFQALGFLQTPTYRIILSEHGKREEKNGPLGKLLQAPFRKEKDFHLGKREGEASPIEQFKEIYPPDAWQEIIARATTCAEEILSEELDEYMEEIATDALDIFDQRALGLRFASEWQQQHAGQLGITMEELNRYNAISEALVEGIRRPVRRLESVCYWVVQGEGHNEHAF
ncbi:MAG: SNF2-related protein [Ktedonobacteraceae bacterium]